MAEGIVVYDTLTREKRPLGRLPGETVKMYVCGPTVYDDPHIGHLRSAYAFDVVRRVIERAGNPVCFVRNVTDVDDKIIDRARAEGLPMETVTAKYLGAYHDALSRMRLREPTHEPAATAHLEEMRRMIAGLIAGGAAYAAAGSVYFRVRRFARYGELSNQKLDEILQNVRVEQGEGKEDALDFALWKASRDDEPSWDSPWGKGRPGWHIECSAMSGKYLGEEFDVHGGGRDLMFPHHENERAQSMAAAGKGFARLWMHHGLITINGQKMAKSLGNFVTLPDFEKRHPLDVLKLFFLQSHYRSDIDFTWEKMAALREAVERFYTFFAKAEKLRSGAKSEAFSDYRDDFDAALADDFDTPRAVAILFDLLREANDHLAKGLLREAEGAAAALRELSQPFGLFAGREGGAGRSKELVERVIALRGEKRRARRYAVSDLIRSELVGMGFKAEDAKDGTLTVIPVSTPGEEELARRLEDLLRRAEGMD